ncbi:MAG: D-aminoacyl-tRNA deacylase [Defluviitaleaceae bacterium]|nr:D-aminoacyl-tRNA deacylase [Defluviitaleaceae bacterium]
MKVVIQRVLYSNIEVNGEIVAAINRGLLVFLGVSHTDTEEQARKLVDKIAKLRIFSDTAGKTNLSIQDIRGELLVVSQFTLYADTKKGNRPSFIDAADPKKANDLYQYFADYAKDKFEKVETGIFGANMKITLTNDGPFTIVMEAISQEFNGERS